MQSAEQSPEPAFDTLADGTLQFAGSRRIDLTGDGVEELWNVEAAGSHAESLAVVLRIASGERTLFTRSWSSTGLVHSEMPAANREAMVLSWLRDLLDSRRLYSLDTLPYGKLWTPDEPWFDHAQQVLIVREGLDSATAQGVASEIRTEATVAFQLTAGRDLSVWYAWSDTLDRFVAIGVCC